MKVDGVGKIVEGVNALEAALNSNRVKKVIVLDTKLTKSNKFNFLIESIKTKILCLDDDTVVYCGHGPATTVGYERVNNPFLK